MKAALGMGQQCRWADVSDSETDDEAAVTSCALAAAKEQSPRCSLTTASSSGSPDADDQEAVPGSCLGGRWTCASEPDAAGGDEASPPRGNLAGVACIAVSMPVAPIARRCDRTAGLSATAPEFIPTMSQECPLVGLCVLPAAGAAERGPQETGESLIADAVEANPELGRLLPGTRSDAAAVKPRATKRGRRKATRSPDQPPHEWGVMPEVSEEVWEHRVDMRRKELAMLEERLSRFNGAAALQATGRPAAAKEEESAAAAESTGGQLIADGQVKGLLLEKPDPTDRTLSRRQWLKATDQWFKASVLRWCPEEGQGSVASTEEWQSLATISTHCDGESECSD